FQIAFEQTQITYFDLNLLALPINADFIQATQPLIVQNVTESFARTVLDLMAEGRPFTETMTTRRFMMTPALMELYAFLDAYQDNGKGDTPDDDVKAQGLTLSIGTAMGPISLADTLNPSSANYMHWYHPQIASHCTHDPMVYAPADARHIASILAGKV